MKEFLEILKAIKENILDHPLVIGGSVFTIGGLLALLIRFIITRPRVKQIVALDSNLANVRKEQKKYVTKEEHNELLKYVKISNAFNEKLVKCVKNEGTRTLLEGELANINESAPKELVVEVEEKPIEKPKARF